MFDNHTELPPLVRSFVGERYAAEESLSDFLAPPYDVISTVQRTQLASRSDHNIVHLILPVANGDRYENAASILDTWRQRGVLQRDVSEGLTILRQTFRLPNGTLHARTGVIAAVAVEPFRAGRVKPHERTHAEPKADRLALLRTTRTVCDALLMLARDERGELQQQLHEVTASPVTARAELDSVSLEIWEVFGDTASALTASAAAGALYIADGHHRYETAVAYQGENPHATRTLGLIVPVGDPGLVVLPTHRRIHGRALADELVLSLLRERFQVRELSREQDVVEALQVLRRRGTACALLLPKAAFLLLLKRRGALGDLLLGDHPTVASLDVARADALVVAPLRDAAASEARVTYTPDAHQLQHDVQRGEAVAGVLLNPPEIREVLEVADAGATMPQKSTYFVPKVPSGVKLLPLG